MSTDPGEAHFPQDGKTIVLAVAKRRTATLAQMFDDAYTERKPSPEIRYADFVVSDTAADYTADAMAKIERFKKEPFPRTLVSVNMLDTGFDAPEVRLPPVETLACRPDCRGRAL